MAEQTGLWAGDGGFFVGVKNNTKLIASSDRAVVDRVNKLITGTLVTEYITNTPSHSVSQVSLGGGFGCGGSAKPMESGLGTTQGGQVACGASKDHAPLLSTRSSRSMTQNAISGWSVVIRDDVTQQDLSGMMATLNALKPIFDKAEKSLPSSTNGQDRVGSNRHVDSDLFLKESQGANGFGECSPTHHSNRSGPDVRANITFKSSLKISSDQKLQYEIAFLTIPRLYSILPVRENPS